MANVPTVPTVAGHTEVTSFHLNEEEIADLEAFLGTLVSE
jgi:hypothetical protein